MIMELWKSIPGFSDYEISEEGKIRSKDRIKKYESGRLIHYQTKEKLLRVHPDNGFLSVLGESCSGDNSVHCNILPN
jgi:hypothetical protein